MEATVGETGNPIDVSEEECELTENEVDMLMDALDDDDEDADASSTAYVEDLGPIEPLGSKPRMDSKLSFSLPEGEPEDNETRDDVSEDATEPSSRSLEISPSASVPTLRKRIKQDDENGSKVLRIDTKETSKKDEWDEARAVSHLLLSPYDSSLGLLSRVDTR